MMLIFDKPVKLKWPVIATSTTVMDGSNAFCVKMKMGRKWFQISQKKYSYNIHIKVALVLLLTSILLVSSGCISTSEWVA